MNDRDEMDAYIKSFRKTTFDGLVIDLSKLTVRDWSEVEMAADGCVSSPLYDRQGLTLAFKHAGLDADPFTTSSAIRDISRLLLIIKNYIKER